MNPCSSIPSPEGDSQPLEELTRRLWGRDPKALAYEAAYAGDGVHSGVAQPSKSFDAYWLFHAITFQRKVFSKIHTYISKKSLRQTPEYRWLQV